MVNVGLETLTSGTESYTFIRRFQGMAFGIFS